MSLQAQCRRTDSLSFSFQDPSTPDLYPLSLHDALPISSRYGAARYDHRRGHGSSELHEHARDGYPRRCGLSAGVTVSRVLDRKSTRLNSSHVEISYAVFCLKKKKGVHEDLSS